MELMLADGHRNNPAGTSIVRTIAANAIGEIRFFENFCRPTRPLKSEVIHWDVVGDEQNGIGSANDGQAAQGIAHSRPKAQLITASFDKCLAPVIAKVDQAGERG